MEIDSVHTRKDKKLLLKCGFYVWSSLWRIHICEIASYSLFVCLSWRQHLPPHRRVASPHERPRHTISHTHGARDIMYLPYTLPLFCTLLITWTEQHATDFSVQRSSHFICIKFKFFGSFYSVLYQFSCELDARSGSTCKTLRQRQVFFFGVWLADSRLVTSCTYSLHQVDPRNLNTYEVRIEFRRKQQQLWVKSTKD